MDADLSHPPDFLKDFWRERQTCDVLIASRYITGGRADMAMSRRILSAILRNEDPCPADVDELRLLAPLAGPPVDELARDVVQQALKRQAGARAAPA